jgi:phosphoheptose isomerase
MTTSQNKFKNESAFAVIRADGTVVTWGDAESGGDSSSVASQLTNVTAIYSNYHAFAALKKDGSVVTWGGDAGYGGGDSSSVASQLTNVTAIYSNQHAFAALKKDGSVVTWGYAGRSGDSSSVASQLTNVTAIYSSFDAFAALKKDGSVVTWGGYAGDSSSVASQLTNVTAIYSNQYAFAALKKDGSVVTWGVDGYGSDSSSVASQLTNVTAIYSNGSAFAALKKDGSVVTWGDGGFGGDSSSVASQLTNVTAIYSNQYAFAALKKDGSVVTWGDDAGYGGGDSSSVASQLTNVTAIYSTELGGAFAALKKDGSVVTWGGAWYGSDSSSVASQLTNVTAIYSNQYAFAALKKDGSVVTWGDAGYGGDSSSVASQLTNVTAIYSNGYAFAALKKDGSVVTWGYAASSGGDSSSVAAQLNGTIDVVKFNDELPSTPPLALAKLRAAFDADEGTQLYQNTKNQYLLSDADQIIGKAPASALMLKSDKLGNTNWAPATGEVILAIDKQSTTTEVILAKTTGTGVTEKTTYSKWVFDNNTGNSVEGKAVALTIDYIVAKETTLNQDLTDDDVIGNGIAQVLPSSGNSGLYTMSSGGYVFSTADQLVGDVPATAVTLKDKAGTKGWAPATGETVIAINDLGATTDVYLAKDTTSGKITTTAYSKWTFTEADGKATATAATKLSALDVLAAEKTLNMDINKDGLLGNAVVKSLATQASSDLYQMTEGYAFLASGQTIGAVPSAITLTDKAGTKGWAPATGETVIAINDLGATTDVYLAKETTSGKITTTAYSKWTFTEADGKATATAATKLSALDVLAAEKTLNMDINKDGLLGNAIVKNIVTQASSGLYQMTEGYAFSVSGQGASVPTTSVTLKDKAGTKGWAPATGETVIGINDLGATTDIYLAKDTLSGKTTTTTYSKWTFTDADGKATAAAATKLSTLDVLATERLFSKDLNGDGLLGNAVVKSLATQASADLYQMTEGYAFLASGQTIGAVPSAITLTDKAGTKGWAPATGETVIGINDLGTTTEVLLAKDTLSGKTTTTTYSKWTFTDADGKATAAAATAMSAIDLSVYEKTLNKDLNGDGLITSLRTTIDNHVYDLVLKPTDWTTANTAAKASKYIVPETGKVISGTLVSIDNAAEKSALDSFIASFASSSFTGKSGNIPYFWTSASDAVKKGAWVWADKISLSSTETNWVSAASKISGTANTYIAEAVADASDSSVLIGQYNNLVGTEKLAYVIEYTI